MTEPHPSAGMWFEEEFDGRIRFGLSVTAYHHRIRSDHQTIEVFDTVAFGRTLALDGVLQTSVGDEYLYHEMLVQPAMTTAPAIARVLVIGGGDGGSIREVLRHPAVEHVTMVELDAMVVEACRDHLTDLAVPWDDPRLELVFADGVTYLHDTDDEFDVIIVDGPDPIGPAAGLFERPFFADCRDRLAPGGVLAAQIEAPHVMPDEYAAIVRALAGTFARVAPYYGSVPLYSCGTWGFAWATDDPTVDHLAVDPARADAVAGACRQWSPDVHRAAFVQPPAIRRLLAR